MKEHGKFRRLARDAKKRLTSGYWMCIHEQRDDAVRQAVQQGRDARPILTYFREKCLRDIASMSNPVDRCEEALYERLKTLWDNGAFIANPAYVVGDAKYAERLDDTERQRYILRMIAKYNALRARYEHERAQLGNISLCAVNMPKL